MPVLSTRISDAPEPFRLLRDAPQGAGVGLDGREDQLSIVLELLCCAVSASAS